MDLKLLRLGRFAVVSICALLLTLLVSLSGCSGSENQDSDKQEQSSEQTENKGSEDSKKDGEKEADESENHPMVQTYEKIRKLPKEEITSLTYDDIVATYFDGVEGTLAGEKDNGEVVYKWKSDDGKASIQITFENVDGVLYCTRYHSLYQYK